MKAFLAFDAVLALTVGAITVDGTAEKLILYAAAVGAVGMLWRKLGRPATQIVKRTADAVEALESLPAWREDHDERLSSLESEVGLAIPAIEHVQNDVSAIRRELGITDNDVRHM